MAKVILLTVLIGVAILSAEGLFIPTIARAAANPLLRYLQTIPNLTSRAGLLGSIQSITNLNPGLRAAVNPLLGSLQSIPNVNPVLRLPASQWSNFIGVLSPTLIQNVIRYL